MTVDRRAPSGVEGLTVGSWLRRGTSLWKVEAFNLLDILPKSFRANIGTGPRAASTQKNIGVEQAGEPVPGYFCNLVYSVWRSHNGVDRTCPIALAPATTSRMSGAIWYRIASRSIDGFKLNLTLRKVMSFPSYRTHMRLLGGRDNAVFLLRLGGGFAKLTGSDNRIAT